MQTFFSKKRAIALSMPKGFTTFSIHKRGFTIVELLIVIAMLGVLGVSVIIVLNPLQQIKKANDARRKSDLKYITNLLNLYYNDNGKYPAPNPGTCDYGATPPCYVFSTAGSSWISLLVPKYAATLPTDPVNTVNGDPRNNGQYTYAYGGVSSDGQHYDLIVQLENQSDPDRCEIKQYQTGFGYGTPFSWCGSSSKYIYQLVHE